MRSQRTRSPHDTIRRSLEDFIQLISKQHYGIVLGLNEAKPSGERSLYVVLEGVFYISTRMGRALEKGKKWRGITIKDTDAFLTHGEVQEKGTEEEGEAADDYGSDTVD